MRLRSFPIITALAGLALASAPASADQRTDATALVMKAQNIVQDMARRPVTMRIPPAVLAQSRGIVIFPSVVKAGLIIGGSHGKGVVLGHQPGGDFSAPAFVSITGGSLGAQIGAEESSIILVLNSPVALDRFVTGKFKLGTDVSAVAGPTGAAGAKKADVYSYTQSKGVFAGASITGASVSVDQDRVTAFYAQPATASQLLTGPATAVTVPPVADDLRRALAQYAQRR
ncbi:MAG TPA: lipid-binding SYLF domain-containing protein [Polyangia bacterium]|jgi:lipid-binding SYLF domain-containing protein